MAVFRDFSCWLIHCNPVAKSQGETRPFAHKMGEAVSHGLQIRFREVAPDLSLLRLALERLSGINERFRQDLLCTVTVARSRRLGVRANVSVELSTNRGRRRNLPLSARAKQGASDATCAMQAAFTEAELAMGALLTTGASPS